MGNELVLGFKVFGFLYGCDSTSLNDLQLIRDEMYKAAGISRMNVIGENFEQFNPQGVSGYLGLVESHMSVHTWPENHYMDIDIHTCGDNSGPDKAMIYMIDIFKPSSGWIARTSTGTFKRREDNLFVPVEPTVRQYPLQTYRKLTKHLIGGMI